MIVAGFIFLALTAAVVVWICWGAFAHSMGWLDMGPGEALRKTLSPTFWRTGE